MKTTLCRILALLLVLLLTGSACLAATDEEIYARGKELLAAGDYLTAAEYFEALGDYLDSADLARQARERRSAANATPQPNPVPFFEPTTAPTSAPARSIYADYGVNQIVTLGRYEQDGSTKNGPEPIQWIILKSEGSRKMLMSLYALDAMPFNNSSSRTTWAESPIRDWLNDVFYAQAFSDAEKSASS